MRKLAALMLGLVLLAGCASKPAEVPLPDLGSFKLGHNVVVASKMQKGPVSREASAEEWKSALTTAMADRFGQHQGEKFYHFGISVEGYMLAPPGVPLVYKPRSALIINVTVWDDAAGRKLNEKVKQLTVFETTSGDSFLAGSGAVRTKEEQMAGLAANAVLQIEKWLLEEQRENGWFTRAPDVDVAPQAETLSE